MANILEQIIYLITQPSGSMVYHLVIAFVFISALQPTLVLTPLSKSSTNRKLILGLFLLISSHLLIFLVSLLALNGNPNLITILAVLEMVVNLYNILTIIWLFAYSGPKQIRDIAYILVSFTIIAAGAISTLFWSAQGQVGTYNQSYLSLGWEISTILFLLIGFIVLLITKSPARTQGLIMMLALLFGEILQVLLINPTGDFFPITRLAHLIAFPLISGVLLNFQPAESSSTSSPLAEVITPIGEGYFPEPVEGKLELEPTATPSPRTIDLSTYQNGLALASSCDPKDLYPLFARYTAHAMLADICLLLSPPDLNNQVYILSGYDLIVQEILPPTSFDKNLIPNLKELLDSQQPILISDRGDKKLIKLANLLGVDQVGQMLACPIMNSGGQILAIILLLSPYSKHQWTLDEKNYILNSSEDISALLEKAQTVEEGTGQDNEKIAALTAELQTSQDRLKSLTAELDVIHKDKEVLAANISLLTAHLEAQTPDSTDAEEIIVKTQSLESAIEILEKENEELKSIYAGLEEQLHSIQEENTKITSQLNESENSSARLSDLSTQNQELNREITALSQRNQELVSELANIMDQSEILTQELNQVKEKNEKSNADNKRASEEIKLLRKKFSELENENKDLISNLADLSKENQSLKSSTGINKADYKKLEQDLHHSLERAKTFELELENANVMIEKLSDFKHRSNGEGLPSEQAEVIASIAQELRQPMSSISGYTDLLISESVGILGALQKKFLERVKASTHRMDQLIKDLIQITTIDSGQFLFTLQPLEILDVIDLAIEATSAQFREKEISLRVDISSDLPKLHTDKDALQQILLHLLQNAGTTTPTQGEITLKAHLYSKTSNDVILLSVTDTGEGIPKEDLPRVFSRLYRADNPLIQGIGDTGVGLSIAKTLTEALGGRIWVESKLGAGSTFSVLMPTSAPTIPDKEN